MFLRPPFDSIRISILKFQWSSTTKYTIPNSKKNVYKLVKEINDSYEFMLVLV